MGRSTGRSTPEAERDAELVLAARGGDGEAFGSLFDSWFDRVFDVAYRIVRNRDDAREVAQDVFVVAWTKLDTLEDPTAFGGWLLRTARNKALNRLEREQRSVALGDEVAGAEIDRRASSSTGAAGDVSIGGGAGASAGLGLPEASVEDAENAQMLWAAADALGERDASVLDLHLRHGMGAPELAEALGVTTNNAHQLIFRLKSRLGDAIRAWVLWHGGRPSCEGLGAALGSAGVVSFGPEAVKVISRHAGACEECSQRQQLRLAPEAMFAAVPIVVVAPFVKAQAASALAVAGVPVPSPSAASAYPSSPSSELASPSYAEQPPHTPERSGLRVASYVGAGLLALVAIIVIALLAASPLGDGTPDDSDVVSLSEELTDPTDQAQAGEGSGDPASDLAPTQGGDDAGDDGGAASQGQDGAASGGSGTDPAPGSEDPGGGGGAGTDPTDPTQPTDPTDPTQPTDPTDPPAPPPVVSGFRATWTGSRVCTGGTTPLTLVWQSVEAETASIAGSGAPRGSLPASGTTTVCAPRSPLPTYTLTVTGPGGSATRSVTAPQGPPGGPGLSAG